MDTIVSKSTMLLSKPTIFPVRTASQTSYYSSMASCSKSLNLRFSSSSSSSRSSSRIRRTQLGHSQVRKLSVSCGIGIQEIDETQFSDSVLKSDGPVLVEFVANWCGPCRLISPAVEWVAQGEVYLGRVVVSSEGGSSALEAFPDL
ncbi:hypothetical protein TIFTF001_048975 [Ficus carica]|uniref:Thioredoxin domain-containing protein n=1 Tax=Ficus carica TaxID=3494 RepID=A0AA87Z1K8_FICCA|nr:hypothetical protein TIFTF001_048975 [Ficus carica]